MVSLELLIDGSRATAGADQVKTALKGVQDEASKTEASVKRAGTSLTSAFQVSGGTLQIGQGISQIARSFQEANIAAAAFGTSRTLLELGRTASEARQLAGGISGVGGAFGSLGLIMRAHPLLTIASLIGAAATAMSVFSSNTDKAAVSMKTARTESDALSRGLSSLAGIRAGGRDPADAVDQILEQLRAEDLQRGLRFGPATSSRGDLQGDYASASGISRVLPQFRLDPNTSYQRGALRNEDGSRGFLEEESLISRTQFISYLESQQRNRLTVSAPRVGEGEDDFYNKRRAESGDAFLEDRRKQTEEALAAMEELKDSARQVGEALGDGVADLVQGLRSAKQVAASLLSDLTRAGLRSAVGGLAAGIASSFGETGAQGAKPKFNTPGVTPPP